MRYIKYGHYVIYETSEQGFKQEAYNTETGTLYKYDFTNIYKYHVDVDYTEVPLRLLLTLLILGEITVYEESLLEFSAFKDGKDVTDRLLEYFKEKYVIMPRAKEYLFPSTYKNLGAPSYEDPNEETPYFDSEGVEQDKFLATSLDEFYTAVGFYSVVYGYTKFLADDWMLSRGAYVYAIDDVIGNFNDEFIRESGRNSRNTYGTRAHKITYYNTFLPSGNVLMYANYGITVGIKTKPYYYVRALQEVVPNGTCRLLPFNLDTIKFNYATKGATIHSLTVTDGKTSVKYLCKLSSLTKQQLHAIAWAELNLYCGYSLALEDFSEECELKDDNVKALLTYAKTLEKPNFTPYYSKLPIRKEIINEI